VQNRAMAGIEPSSCAYSDHSRPQRRQNASLDVNSRLMSGFYSLPIN
jgi:hypothetical protein